MCESQLPTRVRNNSQDLSQTRWHHPHSSRKGGKPSAQLLVPAPRNIPGVFLEAEHPSEWLIPRYLQGNNFSSLKEWCSLLADLFIQLRFSNSCHGLGLGLIPRRTVSKRVTAAGNVQRGLFYLEKGDVRGFFFFWLLLLQLHILCFQAQKEQEASENNPAWKGSAHKSQGRIFFFLGFFLVHWIFFGIT